MIHMCKRYGAIAITALLVSACATTGNQKTDVSFVPTGPTADGVPAPEVLYLFGPYEKKCAYTFKVGDAVPVVLHPGEYMIVEVWPGMTPFFRKQTNLAGFWSAGCSSTDGHSGDLKVSPGKHGNLTLDVSFPADPSWTRSIWTTTLLEDPEEYVSGHKLAAVRSIHETTPAQQWRDLPYYGPVPKADQIVKGRVTFPAGTFVGEIKGNELVRGEYRANNGETYIGEVAGVKYDGQGTLVQSDGAAFYGTFSKGHAHGEGICSAPGEAPNYCARQQGKPVPPPSVEAAAEMNVASAELNEAREQAAPYKKALKELEQAAESLKQEQQNASQNVLAEKAKTLKQCNCYFIERHNDNGSTYLEPVLQKCLVIVDRERDTAEGREQTKRAIDQERRACHAWLERTGGLTDDALIEAELQRIGKDYANVVAQMDRKKREAAAEQERLKKKHEAERAERIAKARVEEDARREQMLAKRRQQCQQNQSPSRINCGCAGFMSGSALAAARNASTSSKGTACPM